MKNKWIFRYSLIITLTLACQFSFVHAEEKEACSTKVSPDGVVVPFVEFIHPTGKKILFIGMIHTGGTDSYRKISVALSQWLAEESKRTVILNEFFSCGSSVLDSGSIDRSKKTALAAGTAISMKQARKILGANIDFTPDKFFNLTQENLGPLNEVFTLHQEPCVADLDGRFIRPRYLVERNRAVCDDYHSRGVTCQWVDFVPPQAPNTFIESGDIKMDEQPAGVQFAAMLLYRIWRRDQSKGRWPGELYLALDRIDKPGSQIIENVRNKQLVEKVRRALFERNFDQVVLPWGAQHIYGVKDLLQGKGWSISKVSDVLFLPKTEKSLSPDFPLFLNSKCRDYDFLSTDSPTGIVPAPTVQDAEAATQ